MAVPDRGSEPDFDAFVADVEPRLRAALVATYGGDVGREAVAEALAFAWERWDRVSAMASPVAFLFRVGQSRTRRLRRSARFEAVASTMPEVWVEPGLVAALERLSPRQRAAVVLVHGYGWTLSEVAAMQRVQKSTVQSHLDRALERLRRELHVDEQSPESVAAARDRRASG